MSVSIYSKLDSFFSKNKISIKEFYSIMGKKSCDSQFEILFQFINKLLANHNWKKKLYVIVNAIAFIDTLFEKNEGVDKKKINEKLLRLQAKVTKLSNDANLILRAIDKEILYFNTTELSNNGRYDLVECIIENGKSIDYIEKVFMYFDGIVNEKDSEENSLFYNIVTKYIKNLKKGNNSKERLLYYNNIMLLMKSQPCFVLDNNEKKRCLNMIYSYIKTLNIKDKNYSFKKSFIGRLKGTVLNKSANEISKIDDLISKYDIHVNFNRKVLNEVKKSKYVYDEKRTRLKDYIISIDGDNPIEIDDGLSAECLPDGTYLLGVHIASPLSYTTIDSPMVEEAINRNSSIYLPKKIHLAQDNQDTSVITMFPRKFSTKIVSLNERQIKNAKSYYFRIDYDGNIIEREFFQSVIKNYKQCSYDEVNDILKHGCDNERLSYTVNILQQISELLSKRIKLDKIYSDKKNNTANPAKLKVGDSLAEQIVSSSMILVGNEVATYFSDKGYPLLYRVHTVSDEDLKVLKREVDRLPIENNSEAFDKLYSMLLHLYPRGRYDLSGSHYGLNLDHYCHCTSPIRRAPDVINERALDVCYFSNPSDKEIYGLEEFIKKSRDTINEKSESVSLFLNEYDRIKTKLKS